MNANIKQINKLSREELEAGILKYEASWHWEYRDTAFVYFGSVPYQLTEGDILTVFSQFGNPVYIKLIRDRDTGKSKGYGFLKYADERSAVLAVDNLNGATVLGRPIRVDHSRFELKNDEDQEEFDEICRTVVDATKQYGGKVGEGGVFDDGEEAEEEDNKKENRRKQEEDDDEKLKQELDPMAQFLSK